MKRLFYIFFLSLFFVQSLFSSKNKPVCDSASAGNNQQACADSVLLQGNIPNSGSVFWSSLTPGVLILNPNSDSTLVTSLSVGQNIFIYTIIGAGGCPNSTDTVIYSVDSIPSRPSAGFDQQVCGGSVVLSGNQLAVGTGSWVVLSGTGTTSTPYSTNPTFTNLSSGANVIRWTSSAGSCVRFDDVVITSFGLPSVSTAGTDQVVCDTVFYLSANTPSSGSGLWSLIDGVGEIFKPNFANTSVDSAFYGDTLVFVWTISSGPCPVSQDTVSVVINIPPSPSLAGVDQVICSSMSVLSATPLQIGQGEWSQLFGTSQINDTLSAITAISSVSAGNNFYVWTSTNGVCPQKRDTIIVTNSENPLPNAGTDQVLCVLSTTLFADTVTAGQGTWSIAAGAGNVLQPSSNQSIVSNLGIGINRFVWTISNGVCPSKSDTVSIEVFAPSTIAFAGPDLAVCSSSVNLSASGAVNGVGAWSVIAGTGSFSSPNSGSCTVSGLSPGQNILVWTIVNGVCPPSSDTIIVTSINATSNAFAGNDTVVCNDSAQLNASAPLVGSGTWSVLSLGPQISSNTITNPLATGLVSGENIFIWTVAAAGTCPTFSDSLIVTRDPNPTVAYAGQDVLTDEVQITLSANAPTTGSGSWTIVGNSGNLYSPQNPNSAFSVSQTGDYVLVWSISNGVCPSSSDTVNISVRFEQIPEVITPNGDGMNDVFKINPLLFNNNIELMIYNRWGALVYENKDYRHDFTGKNNSGTDLPDDSYFYEVFLNGVSKYKGYILIKRK